MSIVAKRLYMCLCGLFLRKNVRYCNKGRLFLNNDALLLNTRHLLVQNNDTFTISKSPVWERFGPRVRLERSHPGTSFSPSPSCLPFPKPLVSFHLVKLNYLTSIIEINSILPAFSHFFHSYFAFFDKKVCRILIIVVYLSRPFGCHL